MKRNITGKLIEWKNLPERKPLLLQGARQVGKTYCLEEFGRQEFALCLSFDFMEKPAFAKLFEKDLDPERIIRDLGLYIDHDIDLEKTLIIFDEIQQCPNALTSLKYFAQKMPHAYIAASGSLLGIGLSDSSFPVGKVERCKLYPMNFGEFLLAVGQERLEELLNNSTPEAPINELLHNKIWEYFKYYMITGGLPEAVNTFCEKINTLKVAFESVRKVQSRLIDDYMDDIAKHSGKLKAVRIQAVFKNIPLQLARENKSSNKFVFKDVLPNGSRYSVLEGPIEWLVKAGLAHKVPICNKAELPLRAYCNERIFKLYFFDVGILGAMLDLAPKEIYAYEYGSYKGYFAENLVLMELICRWNRQVYSWSSNTSEIEFLMDYSGSLTPIEVKAGINRKAKSLKVFSERYNPENSLLLTGRPMQTELNRTVHLPLYMAAKYPFES